MRTHAEVGEQLVRRIEALSTASPTVRHHHEIERPGAHGTQVAFLHPSSLGGVLIELCQASPSKPE